MSGLWYFWGSLALLLGGYFVYGAFVEKYSEPISGVPRRSKAGATAWTTLNCPATRFFSSSF